jgi:type II secretory pathway pseudopilin PulG
LTLIDTMISLAISSSLLVAVAAAFNSSSKAIENNDQFTRAAQAARVSINQIMTEIRRCSSYPIVAADHSNVDMMTYALEHRVYAWLSGNNTLIITRENMSPWITNTMATNVTSCSFSDDGKTITMTVTVKVGVNQVVLSGSATPRRMVTYQ